MTDKLEILNKEEEKLKATLDKIDWLIYYGTIKIQIRAGKPTVVIIEKTIKLD